MQSRPLIVAQARTWLGTRFHHQGRVKAATHHKGGCDCIGLVLGVAGELGMRTRNGSGQLLTSFDEKGYNRLPDGFRLQAMLQLHLHEIPVENATLGDILLFSFDKNPQHVAIVSDYDDGKGIIHCYAQARKVVEHRLDKLWKDRVVAAYCFMDVV